MSAPGNANVDLAVAILEVGTAARGLKHLALSMGDQQTDVQAILFLLTQNVEALHDNLARAYHGPACDGLFAPGNALRARFKEIAQAEQEGSAEEASRH